METTLQQTIDNILLEQSGMSKELAADILQNDVSQTLAAVLLWLQTAMREDDLSANTALQLAETNLKGSIKKLVQLHYALLEESQ